MKETMNDWLKENVVQHLSSYIKVLEQQVKDLEEEIMMMKEWHEEEIEKYKKSILFLSNS